MSDTGQEHSENELDPGGDNEVVVMESEDNQEEPSGPSNQGSADLLDTADDVADLGYVCTRPALHCTVAEAKTRQSAFVLPKGFELADPTKYFKDSWLRNWLVIGHKTPIETRGKPGKRGKVDEILYFWCMCTKNCAKASEVSPPLTYCFVAHKLTLLSC